MLKKYPNILDQYILINKYDTKISDNKMKQYK